MHTKVRRLLIAALAACALIVPLAYAEPSLENEIHSVARMGQDASAESIRALAARVKQDQSKAFSIASKGLAKQDITFEERVFYVWTLGLTDRQEAVKLILAQLGEDAPKPLRATAESALAELGGEDAGKYLMARLAEGRTDEYRLHMLNLLSQFHYAAALDSAEYLLRRAPDQTDWESVYIFTKMGAAAVPWLIQRLEHPERSIRLNAVILLGQWLIAPEASAPLMKRFEQEREPEARALILDAIERTTYDLKAAGAFMAAVARKEKAPNVRAFAEESMANASRMREALKDRRAKAAPNRKRFDEEYALLFESKGTKSDYAALADSASASDEGRLIALREQVLRRRSADALEDAQEINRAILIQRFLRRRQGGSGIWRRRAQSASACTCRIESLPPPFTLYMTASAALTISDTFGGGVS